MKNLFELAVNGNRSKFEKSTTYVTLVPVPDTRSIGTSIWSRQENSRTMSIRHRFQTKYRLQLLISSTYSSIKCQDRVTLQRLYIWKTAAKQSKQHGAGPEPEPSERRCWSVRKLSLHFNFSCDHILLWHLLTSLYIIVAPTDKAVNNSGDQIHDRNKFLLLTFFKYFFE